MLIVIVGVFHCRFETGVFTFVVVMRRVCFIVGMRRVCFIVGMRLVFYCRDETDVLLK